jgi:hypothetical protein
MRCIGTLLESLEQRCKDTRKKPLDEEDADRFVRREVVRALGEGRWPAIGKLPKVDSPAWWLLRVARKDGITPVPNLSEQIEAAIGVCHLQPKLTPDYNVDQVAYQVALFVVEFAGHFNNRTNLTPPNNGATIYWKASTSRLLAGLDKLQEVAPKDPYVAAVVKNAKATIAPVVEKAQQSLNPAPLADWLQKNQPKNTTVIKSVASTTIAAEPGK